MDASPSALRRLTLDQLEVYRRAASILTSSMELEAALDNTIAACLPALGDFGFFDVILPDGVRRTARAPGNAALEQQLKASQWQRNERVDMNLCALSSGEAALHENTDDAWFARAFPGVTRTLPFYSMLSVPVRHGSELIGSLTLFMADSARRHGAADVEFAAEMASLAAPVVLKTRLIAQQRAVEAALRTSEQRFQLALQMGGMGAWQWDMQADKVHWWPGMAELHGLPAGTQLRQVKDYLELVHPDDRAMAGRSLSGAVGESTGTGLEYRILWPDGSVRWLEGRGDTVLDEDGAPKIMSGICADITHRKLTEQRLRFVARASAELAELVEHEETLTRIARLAVPDFADWCAVDLLSDGGQLKRLAVAHIDPDKVRLAHELHERYPPDPTAASGTWQVIHSGKPELMAEISDEALAESIKDPVYLQIVRDLGLRSYIGVPLITRGKTIGVMTFISAESLHTYGSSDVELAEEIARRAGVAIDNSILYRSLQESDRRKDDFLAMLAHELRNPLAPISAAADMLRLTAAGDQRTRKASDVISRQVRHMTALVDDLLDVSRVTRGLVQLEKVPLDVKAVVARAIEQSRPLIESRQHALTVRIEPSQASVEGDATRLIQVVANLLNNAAKYTPPGGAITLSVAAGSAGIDISVADSGIGIDGKLLPHVFDLFVQAERTPDRAQGGLGIGLALVKTIVALHGGTVTARSAGPGAGSTFTILLPALQQPRPALHGVGAHAGAASHADARKRAVHVMIVDDNIDAAESLAALIEAQGHRVSAQFHPLRALAAAHHDPPDVFVLDIGLPDIDGYELARRLRALPATARACYIALTGYGQAHDRELSSAVGFDHHFVKPIDIEALDALLQQLQPQSGAPAA